MQVWGWVKFKHLDLDHKDRVDLVQRRRQSDPNNIKLDPDFPNKLEELWVWHRKNLGEKEVERVSEQSMSSMVQLGTTADEAHGLSLLHDANYKTLVWCMVHTREHKSACTHTHTPS